MQEIFLAVWNLAVALIVSYSFICEASSSMMQRQANRARTYRRGFLHFYAKVP